MLCLLTSRWRAQLAFSPVRLPYQKLLPLLRFVRSLNCSYISGRPSRSPSANRICRSAARCARARRRWWAPGQGNTPGIAGLKRSGGPRRARP
jgi:hypothetical protein